MNYYPHITREAAMLPLTIRKSKQNKAWGLKLQNYHHPGTQPVEAAIIIEYGISSGTNIFDELSPDHHPLKQQLVEIQRCQVF